VGRSLSWYPIQLDEWVVLDRTSSVLPNSNCGSLFDDERWQMEEQRRTKVIVER
jgi:hypothetical protein